MQKKRRLLDEYRLPGFHPRAYIKGIFGDPQARVIGLERTQKKQFVDVAVRNIKVITTRGYGLYGIYLAERCEFICRWKFGEYGAGRVGK